MNDLENGMLCVTKVIQQNELSTLYDGSELGLILGRSLPDFRTLESCRTMPLVGGFLPAISRFPRPCIPVVLHTQLVSPFIGSQDLDVKGSPDLSTSLHKIPMYSPSALSVISTLQFGARFKKSIYRTQEHARKGKKTSLRKSPVHHPVIRLCFRPSVESDCKHTVVRRATEFSVLPPNNANFLAHRQISRDRRTDGRLTDETDGCESSLTGIAVGVVALFMQLMKEKVHVKLKAVHDNVSTFEINLRKNLLPVPAYILTGTLSDMRPVKLVTMDGKQYRILTLENCKAWTILMTISTAHELNEIEFGVEDDWIGTLLLAGLPNKYRPMIMGIVGSGAKITADATKGRLFQDKLPTNGEDEEKSREYTKARPLKLRLSCLCRFRKFTRGSLVHRPMCFDAHNSDQAVERFCTHKESPLLKVSYAVYIPEVPVNPLSVRKVVEKGNNVTFDMFVGQTFGLDSERIATRPMDKGVYKLDVSPQTCDQQNDDHVTSRCISFPLHFALPDHLQQVRIRSEAVIFLQYIAQISPLTNVLLMFYPTSLAAERPASSLNSAHLEHFIETVELLTPISLSAKIPSSVTIRNEKKKLYLPKSALHKLRQGGPILRGGGEVIRPLTLHHSEPGLTPYRVITQLPHGRNVPHISLSVVWQAENSSSAHVPNTDLHQMNSTDEVTCRVGRRVVKRSNRETVCCAQQPAMKWRRSRGAVSQVILMFIIVVTIFAVCWLPYHGFFIYSYHNTALTVTRYVQHVYLAFYWFAMANAMVNPLIYYWMNCSAWNYFLSIVTDSGYFSTCTYRSARQCLRDCTRAQFSYSQCRKNRPSMCLSGSLGGAAVTRWLERSSCTWELCRKMPLVGGGFLGDLLFPRPWHSATHDIYCEQPIPEVMAHAYCTRKRTSCKFNVNCCELSSTQLKYQRLTRQIFQLR
ncbi:hypothetical protein PR048_032781 [Dryococelus australis]|uniref:G-protein coupled receptors family 1 profile domain-containing protein n=1 Tax=Dryococelus australis TaxID=614101 RepID=A0ABQ9G370_9NEOP|nr:hypothetical protein PR048_032781 [Dryococelus australis]